MAYSPNNLSVLSYANGFTLWHYTTHDSAAGVCSSGYFDSASDMLRVGDMMLVNCDTLGEGGACILLVSSNAWGVVGASNITPFGSARSTPVESAAA